MNTLIVGMGEVGTSLTEVLAGAYTIFTKDVAPAKFKEKIDVMHICLRYGPGFVNVVHDYIKQYDPMYINICTTVPPGTTRACHEIKAVHSTTRGLHPKLSSGLRSMVKHVGGPGAEFFARYFEKAGVECATHTRPETTELAHILNNAAYGVGLMFADEMSRLCRQYGVDYFEAVMKYTETNNNGFIALDQPTKVRPILTPPGGRIGGHCVVQSAQLIPPLLRTPILAMLAEYNGREKK